MKLAWVVVSWVAACAGPDVAPPLVPQVTSTPLDGALSSPLQPDDAELAATAPAPAEPEVWLKGSTHVHAKPSGDSTTPIDDVMTWYEARGYDFIALTDHNRVSEVDGGDTHGKPWVHLPDARHKLIVLSGIELTFNPSGCLPPGDKSKKCRIHVNVLGPTARPGGRLEWAERHSHDRLDMYHAAFLTSRALDGALVQINHPQWFWGMTGELLGELAKKSASLVEIANVQFATWNEGDKDHASTEQLWDEVLAKGLVMWGVASDDAHAYPAPDAKTKGKWPAGGGWIVVKARRDPRAILAALAAGHFYASTGVVLQRAEVANGELVVELDPSEPTPCTIDWIENGKIVATEHARTAHRTLPATGYLRANITRDDGAHAWIEPARR